jgi:regulator of protease activity HflC (stomatin/prohibitin superfamily)
MFGIQFIKALPTTYLLHYKKGRLVREGAGLSFFYFEPDSSLVSVPLASVDVPFIFKEVTSDYQELTAQGQVSYRIADPKKVSQMLNFSLDPNGQKYMSDDPQKLSQRVINRVQIAMRGYLQNASLKEAISFSENLAKEIRETISKSEAIKGLGIEIIDLSLLSIKPSPETSRALEADIREQLLKHADEAIYSRRNAAIEQERSIKENELNTEIAIESKKRVMKDEDLRGQISLEDKRKELVALRGKNAKEEADTKAYSASAILSAYSKVDPKVLQALTSVGMGPEKLIALAFQEMAENADKIGQLNMSPDLLSQLIKTK